MRRLALGARLTLAGGRAGLLRTAITAVGVALGVVVLLVAASVPSIRDARQARGEARMDVSVPPDAAPAGPSTLLAVADTRFRGRDIFGRLLEGAAPPRAGERSGAAGSGGAAPARAGERSGAAGSGGAAPARAGERSGAAGSGGAAPARADAAGGAGAAPRPPGIDRLPERGEVFVSPALARLLASADGQRLLAPRIPGRVVGEIGPAGLLGPNELAFYAGASGLGEGGWVTRVERFGSGAPREPLPPALALLLVIVVVALLLPVAVLVAAAVRTGGEERDRRLAALRLIGADQRMARRIAAGEALLSAAGGLTAGALGFVLVRGAADRIAIWDASVFGSDMRPAPLLAAAVIVGVPAAAVLMSLLALRRVVAEPLGVVRRAAPGRRRLWWRLLLPAAGLAALAPAAGQGAAQVSQARVAVGVIAVLVGVAALLPWVVERAVARLGAGRVAWQLAVRRLQLDPGSAARAVSGITVAVAGAIALQMVFAGIQDDYRSGTGADLARASLIVQGENGAVEASGLAERLRAVPGVRSALALAQYEVDAAGLTVAPCAALREVAGISSCRDGDAFSVGAPPPRALGAWTLPAGAREVPPRADPTGLMRGGVFATPGAVRGTDLPAPFVYAYVRTDAGPDVQEHVRNAVAAISPQIAIQEVRRTRTDVQFAQVRRAMLIGASIVIGLIGLSLLLTALEQVRERRRALAVLVAFGTRRSTLGWSVLWQSALPVGLGIAIATATGIALGSVLLRILGAGVHVAWADVAAMAAVGALVVLLVTAASLPVLWRTMRPDGLRTE